MSREYRQGKLAFEKQMVRCEDWKGDPSVFQVPPDCQRVTYHEYLEESLPDTKEETRSPEDLKE